MTEEEDVGITEYVSSCPGFAGILKHRYRDFQVFEVDAAGNVAHLTDLQPPGPAQAPAAAKAADAESLQAALPALAARFGEVAGSQNAQLLQAFLASIAQQLPQQQQAGAAASDGAVAAAPATAAPAAAAQPLQLVLQPIASKDARRAAHSFLRTAPGLPPLATDVVFLPAPAQEPDAAADTDMGAGAGAAAGAGVADGSAAGSDAAAASSQQVHCIRVTYNLAGPGAKGDAAGGEGSVGGKRKRGDAEGGGGGGGGGGKRGKGGRGAWKEGPQAAGSGGHEAQPPYTKFVLYKENMDTQAALALLGRMLGHVKPASFGFAGTKDKRGVTCQFATVYRIAPGRLAALNERLHQIRLGNFEPCGEQLHLGALSGNEFRVLIRSVEAGSEEQVAAACREVAAKGFINYFGLQRFGAGGTPTHKVGSALLRGDLAHAVRMIMAGRPDERQDVAAARAAYLERGDAKGALQGLPSFMVSERSLMAALSRAPGDLAGALLSIPRTLRMMYLHAYQSALWNAAASHRVRTHGTAGAVEGDLVLLPAPTAAPQGGGAGSAAAADGDAAAAAAAAGAAADGASSVGEDAEAAAAAAAAAGDDDASAACTSGSAAGRLGLVHVVTAEEAAAGVYRLCDVVLPLPGQRSVYPQHSTADVYRQLAEADGMPLPGLQDSTGQPPAHKVRELSWESLTGDYRHVVLKPMEFSWQLVRYRNPDDDSLASTDLEALQQQQQQQQRPSEAADKAVNGSSHNIASDGGKQGDDGGGALAAAAGAGEEAAAAQQAPAPPAGSQEQLPLLGLWLRFQLPSSCYATMLVRELTKRSSSTAAHKSMSLAAGATAALPSALP